MMVTMMRRILSAFPIRWQTPQRPQDASCGHKRRQVRHMKWQQDVGAEPPAVALIVVTTTHCAPHWYLRDWRRAISPTQLIGMYTALRGDLRQRLLLLKKLQHRPRLQLR